MQILRTTIKMAQLCVKPSVLQANMLASVMLANRYPPIISSYFHHHSSFLSGDILSPACGVRLVENEVSVY